MDKGSRVRGILTAALAAGALLAAAPAAATAAPKSFYGVVPQTSLGVKDFERMQKGHVGVVRLPFAWQVMDPSSAPDDYDFSATDELMANAARSKVRLLPFLSGSPSWVARDLDNRSCAGVDCVPFAPKSAAALGAWSDFVAATVARYGRNGTFWAQHPELPARPIRNWQIWNEQNSREFFAPKSKPRAYAKVLRAAASAIRSKDPSADVVLGGMAQLAGSSKAKAGSKYLRSLYRIKRIEKSFDGVAVHPYGAKAHAVIEQVERFRDEIKRAHDKRAGLWVTEAGWSSARKGNPLNVGTRGQAKRLKDAFKYFSSHRRALNLKGVLWFSWMDSPQSICDWCKKSGLMKSGLRPKPAWRAFTRFTHGR